MNASKPPIAEVEFAAFDAAKLPHDFLLTEADRDRRPAQERPGLDKMFEAPEGEGGEEKQPTRSCAESASAPPSVAGDFPLHRSRGIVVAGFHGEQDFADQVLVEAARSLLLAS